MELVLTQMLQSDVGREFRYAKECFEAKGKNIHDYLVNKC
jgi:hypothetical protein